MNTPRSQKTSPQVPPAAYDELCDFLHQSGSPLTPAEAIAGARTHWQPGRP